MMGPYPYFMAALLLIYPQSTTQDYWFSTNEAQIGDLLLREKTEINGSQFFLDIVCDRLTENEKRELCDGMHRAIISGRETDKEGPVDFVEKETNFAVPRMVDLNHPYKCKSIPIKGLGMRKRMLWCSHRVYKYKNSNELYAKGFFISSGLMMVDQAFLFRPSSKNSASVVPFAKMEWLFDVVFPPKAVESTPPPEGKKADSPPPN